MAKDTDPRFSDLTDEQRVALAELLSRRAEAVAWRCERETCDGQPHEGREYRHARSAQCPPWGETVTLANGEVSPIRRWYLRGGRGSGKTWAGARALVEIILWYGGSDENGNRRAYGVVGPNFSYAKQTLLEGDSGLLGALGGVDGPHVEDYNRTTGTITLKSGAIIYTGGAENNGGSIEGKNLTAIWCDEVGLWSLRRWEYTWKQAIGFAVRKSPALFIFTGTPKHGHPFVRLLAGDPRVKTVVMATKDNKALDAGYMAELEAEYAGTRLGRQELEGEVLMDTPGALWTSAQIETSRLFTSPLLDDMSKIVVGWDPAVTSGENSDEHGIVVAGVLKGEPDHYVVLEDFSGQYTPMEAARMVSEAYEKWQADAVIAETNNGGDLIPALLRTVSPTIPVTKVTATRGKRLRAEPIAALSEQERLHILGTMPKLEDQMTTWSPEMPGSPDRLDAMVWAITALTELKTTSSFYVRKRQSSGGM